MLAHGSEHQNEVHIGRADDFLKIGRETLKAELAQDRFAAIFAAVARDDQLDLLVLAQASGQRHIGALHYAATADNAYPNGLGHEDASFWVGFDLYGEIC